MLKTRKPNEITIYRNYIGDFIEIKDQHGTIIAPKIVDAYGLDWETLEEICEELHVDCVF